MGIIFGVIALGIVLYAAKVSGLNRVPLNVYSRQKTIYKTYRVNRDGYNFHSTHMRRPIGNYRNVGR